MESVKARIEKTKYETILTASGNKLIADENISNGGNGRGFTPAELMAASLASCTSITLRMYADHKEWDLQNAEVMVAFETNNGATTFKREIILSGNLDTSQKERLSSIADKCPMHKLLSNSISINTSIK